MKSRADNFHQQDGKKSRRDFMGAVAAAVVMEAYRICDDF